MKIEDLKQGDKFFEVSTVGKQVRRFEYFTEMPVKNAEISGKYFIFIDELYQPKRLYKTDVERLLEKNIRTYDEALLVVRQRLQDDLDFVNKQLSCGISL